MKKDNSDDGILRVAFISHDSDLLGGATRSLVNLVDGLRDHGIEAVVFCPARGELTSALTEMGVAFETVPFRSWLMTDEWRSRIRASARLAFNLLLLPLLIWRLKSQDVDVIYSNSSATPAGALSAMLLGKPHVWHVRESLRDALDLRPVLGERALRYLWSSSDSLISVSDFIRRSVLNGVGSSVHVVKNGVVRDRELQSERGGDSALAGIEGYKFAYLGHIRPSKAQDEAIRALARIKDKHPHVVLLIAGAGLADFIQHLKDLSRELGVEHQVRFLGYLPDPFPVYKAADAVIVASKDDALPRTATEAMAMGKPVIGLRSGALPEIIDEGVTGLLYGNGSEELAKCMERFIEDPSWANSLGVAGREKARKTFTVEACASSVAEILYEVRERSSIRGHSSQPKRE